MSEPSRCHTLVVQLADMTAHELARAIEALARRQHGAFNRTQARDLGASTSQIDRRLLSGAWIRLAPSVYALPGNPPTFARQCMAATLGEPSAWISGATAVVLHRLEGFRAGADRDHRSRRGQSPPLASGRASVRDV